MSNAKQQILEAATKLAEKSCWLMITRTEIVNGTSGALNYYFGSIAGLREEVMLNAIATGNHRIVAQGLALRHPMAVGAPAKLKKEALQWMGSADA